MIVRKFGGTSVGSPDRMKSIKNIINDNSRQIIVLSAISGITNWLEEISSLLFKRDKSSAAEQIKLMTKKYHEFVDNLLSTENYRKQAHDFIDSRSEYLLDFTQEVYTILQEKALLSDGELVSTILFQYFLEEEGMKVKGIPALSFMRIDKDLEPDEYYIQENINRELEKYTDTDIFITQGYICRNAYGEVDNLKRGGSDYSATLIGAAIEASSIEIWTDIDGIHNNDPRYVDKTYPIDSLSFDEAAELAYFGAKILHPASLIPAKKHNIEVFLKNTMNPSHKGTVINKQISGKGIKAIAAKDNITVVRIKSARMLNAYGFLRKVFEVFEVYKTPIDMITTSEVAISVTIDNNRYLDDIIEDLSHFCEVEYDKDNTIVAVVGLIKTDKKGYATQVFDSLENIAIKMISYGASDNNISILLDSKDKKAALESIQNKFFLKG